VAIRRILAMFSATTHVIRPATPQDDITLRSLAALDSQRPIASPVLIGERDGRPVAAISLADGRLVADPFVPTAQLAALLRMRAGALNTHKKQPSLRERIRAGLRPVAIPA
jgi:hypothetical protein